MLTVLLATRNGEKTLPAVLDAYRQLHGPDSGWKLVVIDNGSTDRTKDIVESFLDLLPLTYKFESAPGKNAALNAGLECVEGDLVVFTDDDAFPRPDWLINLRAGADAQQSYSVFGGVILPRWEVPPPAWVAWVDQSPTFALTDPALKEGPVPASIFGPNMAIRTALFDSGVRFDVSIGPSGKNYAMGSESELIQRLLRQGHKAWHISSAIVEHFIRDFQMEKSWILERAIRFGRGQYRISQAEELPLKTHYWLGVPRFLVRGILQQIILLGRAGLTFDEEKFFCERWEFNFQMGKIIEARILHNTTRVPL